MEIFTGFLVEPGTIMVTDDEMLFPMKFFEGILCVIAVIEHIANYIDGIPGMHPLIPVGYHSAVHFFDTFEWTVCKAYDITMTEVGVGDKVDQTISLLSFLDNRIQDF